MQIQLTEEKLQKDLLQERLVLIEEQHSTEIKSFRNAKQQYLVHIDDLHTSLQTHKQSATRNSDSLQQLKQMVLTLKGEVRKFLQHTSTEIAAHLQGLQQIHTSTENHQRALELAKLEAFDKWLSKPAGTKEEVITKQIFEKITSKISYMSKSLQDELRHAITEREEL